MDLPFGHLVAVYSKNLMDTYKITKYLYGQVESKDFNMVITLPPFSPSPYLVNKCGKSRAGFNLHPKLLRSMLVVA